MAPVHSNGQRAVYAVLSRNPLSNRSDLTGETDLAMFHRRWAGVPGGQLIRKTSQAGQYRRAVGAGVNVRLSRFSPEEGRSGAGQQTRSTGPDVREVEHAIQAEGSDNRCFGPAVAIQTDHAARDMRAGREPGRAR
jgi:hypothetical protein